VLHLAKALRLFTAVFKKIKILWDVTSVDWCVVTDISKKPAIFIISVVQEECHKPVDLNHYRYFY
jgi:hypothetical protein